MKIADFEILSERETLARLKRTRLRGFNRPEVYRDATLEIKCMEPGALVPSQRYVLRAGVDKIMEIYEAFAPIGVDVFSLRGALRFWPEGSNLALDPPIPFLPPIVEESIERDGNKLLLINDGMHRVFAARKVGSRISVVLATNVPPEYPYYAYALPGGWAQVDELAELQEGYQKKEYRNPENYKALFRDFNEIFEGVQKQRTAAPQEEPKR